MIYDNCTEQEPCLFNISADPCEHVSLAKHFPNLVSHMLAKIGEYRQHTILPSRNFRRFDPASDPERHGPALEGYHGVYRPWLSPQQDAQFYPSKYNGPGYPMARENA